MAIKHNLSFLKNSKTFHFRRQTAPGAAPGEIGLDKGQKKPIIRAFTYNAEQLQETRIDTIDDLPDPDNHDGILWVVVDGLGDRETIAAIGKKFAVHQLALEDMVHTDQRPKLDKFDNHDLLVTRVPRRSRKGHLEMDQLAILVGANWVLTLRPRQDDFFAPLYKRLEANKGLLRKSGADYLVYAIVDLATDCYFPVLENLGDELDELDEKVIVSTDRNLPREVHMIKRELLLMTRAIRPQQDMVRQIIDDDNNMLTDEVMPFMRDLLDHGNRIYDMVESYRELSSSILDLFLSLSGDRMNEVMKLLTVVSTVFIPLGFLTGLWGMNFDTSHPLNMPELGYKYGYPVALGVMAAIVLVQFWYFYKKGWLSKNKDT